MVTSNETAIIGQMLNLSRSAGTLSETDIAQLTALTRRLVRQMREQGLAELRRFEQIGGLNGFPEPRQVLPQELLGHWLRGRRVLITGVTGCVGGALARRVREYGPSRLFGLSRGIMPFEGTDDFEYYQCDIADWEAVRQLFAELQPEVVFHVAGQRDPGLAERLVRETLETNVVGTANVIEAAEVCGTEWLAAASSGKALRPASASAYATSKMLMEFVLAMAARRGNMRVGLARFTHVVQNSIIAGKLVEWALRGEPVTLLAPDTAFLAQPVAAAVDLLLVAGLEEQRGRLSMVASRELGRPIELLPLAIGTMARLNRVAPIQFTGAQPGYEERPFPGLYPEGVRFSPMFWGPEAAQADPSGYCPAFDHYALRWQQPPAADAVWMELRYALREPATEETRLRELMDRLIREILPARLGSAPRSVVAATAAATDGVALGEPEELLARLIREAAGAAILEA